MNTSIRLVKSFSRLALVTALFASLSTAWAAIPSDELLFKLSADSPTNKPTPFVQDLAGVFTEAQRTNLNNDLALAARSTNGVVVVVVALPTLQGGVIEDFAAKLFAAWGIGKTGKDNGVLILCPVQDRALKIEIGRGLEGIITDAMCGRIEDEFIVPALKAGRTADGLSAGARRIVQVVNEKNQPATPGAIASTNGAAGTGKQSKHGGIVIIVFVILFVVMVVAAKRNKGNGNGGSSNGNPPSTPPTTPPSSSTSSSSSSDSSFGGGKSSGGGATRHW